MFGRNVAQPEQPGIGQIDQKRGRAVHFGLNLDPQHDFVDVVADLVCRDVELDIDRWRALRLVNAGRIGISNE
jgi:hypothetical protein